MRQSSRSFRSRHRLIVRPTVLLAAALAAVLVFAASPAPAHASVSVVDDAGRTVTLREPARRIVSLAPHATEVLFAAGAGDKVVGVVEYTDYPPQAQKITSVGSGVALDLERILALKPDLVVAWSSGNSAVQIKRLREMGVAVFESEARDFLTIAATLERLGTLAGTAPVAQLAAESFRTKLAAVQARYQGRPRLTVFYQIWRSPLMTLNGEHLVSQALRMCGAKNIFEHLPQLAPAVNVESVVKLDPDAIVTGASRSDEDPFAMWRRFSSMQAVAKGNLLQIDGWVMNRAGPRIVDATEALCRELDAARARH